LELCKNVSRPKNKMGEPRGRAKRTDIIFHNWLALPTDPPQEKEHAAQRLALLALGRAAERRPNGKKLRRRNCLKNASTPQRQVHAVLARFCRFN
jgi:hypothetical protein